MSGFQSAARFVDMYRLCLDLRILRLCLDFSPPLGLMYDMFAFRQPFVVEYHMFLLVLGFEFSVCFRPRRGLLQFSFAIVSA